MVTKAGKMSTNIEIAIDGGNRPYNARSKEALQAANLPIIAAILHNGKGLANLLCHYDDSLRLFHGASQWFFAQDMTTILKCCYADFFMGFRYSAVEYDVRSGLL